MDSAKVIAQTSELTDTPVRQRSYEKHEINLNAFPVPMEVDELSGGEALRTSLFNHSAKFHKTCKLKFGKEKLEKVIKRHEKQDNFGTLEKHSTLKGKWKLWFHPVLIMYSHSYHHFFYPDDSAVGLLSKNCRTDLMNLFLGSQYSNIFEILMIKWSSTRVSQLLIL